jgi:hypothetical protein
VIYRPRGAGPFPAILYNHGSAPGIVRDSRAPIFFFQAENDYDLSPSRTLSTAMKDAGNEFKLKIYPPFGKTTQDGHTFGYFGSTVWGADVFRFLGDHCRG